MLLALFLSVLCTVALALRECLRLPALFSVRAPSRGAGMGPRERAALREVVRRYGPKKAAARPARLPDFLRTFFDRQQEVLASEAELNAVLCTRRAGKSKSIPGLLLEAAERYPGTVVYYIHPDGGSRAVETLLGPDINLGRINEEYGLGYIVNLNKRSLTNPRTRAEIRIRGADDVREIKKYRGDKVSRVVVDESQNFPAELLRALVEDHVGPALADVGGQIFLCGTPGEVCHGFWYAITRNEDAESRALRAKGWRVFEWSALDNPHVAQQIARTVARKVAALPEASSHTEEQLTALLATREGRAKVQALASEAAAIIREWFGRWVNDVGALFYAWNPKVATYDGHLPSGHTWFHVLGADLGTGDAYAHHVWAVSPTCAVVYERESFSQAGLHAGEWRQKVAAAIRRWNPVAVVVDEGGLGKGVCDEWRALYGLPVEPATKQHKAAAQATLNGEAREGRVKLLPGPVKVKELDLQGGATAAEWAALRKVPGEPGKPATEDPTQPNHASDAALYSHRKALQLAGRETTPEERPTYGTPEWHERQAEEREQDLAERMEQQLNEQREADRWNW